MLPLVYFKAPDVSSVCQAPLQDRDTTKLVATAEPSVCYLCHRLHKGLTPQVSTSVGDLIPGPLVTESGLTNQPATSPLLGSLLTLLTLVKAQTAYFTAVNF